MDPAVTNPAVGVEAPTATDAATTTTVNPVVTASFTTPDATATATTVPVASPVAATDASPVAATDASGMTITPVVTATATMDASGTAIIATATDASGVLPSSLAAATSSLPPGMPPPPAGIVHVPSISDAIPENDAFDPTIEVYGIALKDWTGKLRSFLVENAVGMLDYGNAVWLSPSEYDVASLTAIMGRSLRALHPVPMNVSVMTVAGAAFQGWKSVYTHWMTLKSTSSLPIPPDHHVRNTSPEENWSDVAPHHRFLFYKIADWIVPIANDMYAQELAARPTQLDGPYVTVDAPTAAVDPAAVAAAVDVAATPK